MYTTLFRFLEEKQKFIQSYIRLHLLKKGLSWQEIISAPVMKKDEYAHYEKLALQEFYNDIGVDIIQGYEHIDNTLYIDQSSIGKTPRSCPATFVGIFDDMRTLFAGTNEAKYLGFNPIAITIDPGTIILPNQYKRNIKKLTDQLNAGHEYIKADYSEIIRESLNGRFHPCGRCSKHTEELINQYAINNDIPIVIFGDMLSTGTQCITSQEKGLYRLNLPASLAVGKQENKSLTQQFDLQSFSGFGCPLLYEVHRKYPYLKKYSIQRILRETRSSALEVGEALDLIWSFYNTKD